MENPRQVGPRQVSWCTKIPASARQILGTFQELATEAEVINWLNSNS